MTAANIHHTYLSISILFEFVVVHFMWVNPPLRSSKCVVSYAKQEETINWTCCAEEAEEPQQQQQHKKREQKKWAREKKFAHQLAILLYCCCCCCVYIFPWKCPKITSIGSISRRTGEWHRFVGCEKSLSKQKCAFPFYPLSFFGSSMRIWNITSEEDESKKKTSNKTREESVVKM